MVELCIKLKCKFIAYVVLHEIAKNQPASKRVLWGADHVVGKFNYFLELENSYGIVTVDRLPHKGEYKFLSDKFTQGLNFPEGGVTVPLDRVKLFTATCNNASHASSAMDIVLGSFRYCINQPFNETSARKMMKNLTELIWADKKGDDLYPFEKGLIFRPKEINRAEYRKEYDLLHEHINSLLNEN